MRIARIFNTYGPRMHPADGRVVSNFMVQALSGEPPTVYGDGSQTALALLCRRHVIDAFVRLMDAPPGTCDPVNLGNPHEITMLELAEHVVRATGATGGTGAVTFRPLPIDDPWHRQPDIAAARAARVGAAHAARRRVARDGALFQRASRAGAHARARPRRSRLSGHDSISSPAALPERPAGPLLALRDSIEW